MPFAALLRHVTGSSPSTPIEKTTSQTLFHTVTKDEADDCDRDCVSCPESGYGRAFDKIGIDTSEVVWGAVKAYSTHVIVATGETDWARDVEEIKGSVMERLSQEKSLITNGRMMISASNIPPPQNYHDVEELDIRPTTVILVPSFTVVENIAPKDVGELIRSLINPGPTTEDPLSEGQFNTHVVRNEESMESDHNVTATTTQDETSSNLDKAFESPTSKLQTYQYPHDFLILICSHRRRDARCGISAPILRKEFEKHLIPLGLWRDPADKRPGGASVVFINHVGGHKYSANVIIYRKSDGQGMWLARVSPRHVEGIVKHTLLEGRVIRPDVHLRGGWNRKNGLTSW
ncbi:Sucrase/ferredoxin-like-domain-containing protein [Geopyxis carbonaria]|nr:Sucrase/ferredoxin-like-domain-containing protein [Geopyxis carbonaria]